MPEVHPRPVVLAGIAWVAYPFFAATTFIGDDHLFLAFARYVANPLVAFVHDQHGGEFYRPWPMLAWWLVGRAASAHAWTWPFALLQLALHATVAVEVAALLAALGRGRRVALVGGALFLVAPFTREAAYWYAASTDLWATAFGLGAIIACVRDRTGLAIALFAGACWSKESAIVVPALCVLALRVRPPVARAPELMRKIVGLGVVAAIYLVARFVVLRGAGGSGDARAPFVGKLIQIGSGVVRIVTGADSAPTALDWLAGGAAWAALLVDGVRRTRRTARAASQGGSPTPVVWGAPLVWLAVSTLPLLAAPWVVGARYFYMSAVAVAWLAAESLACAPMPVVAGVFSVLVGFCLTRDVARAADVAEYEARLGAARRAVAAGLADGHETFQIAAGIKDLDLAIKEDPRFRAAEARLIVLGDVPASFVALPYSRADELDFVVARPPLPPAGAYRFGTRRVVGLARRGDEPTLDEVVAHLPGIRFIRLRSAPGGRVIFRDVTEALQDSDVE